MRKRKSKSSLVKNAQLGLVNFKPLVHYTKPKAHLTYSEKCKLPQFQQWAAEIKGIAGWACEDCGTRERQLHAHHTAYIFGMDPWDHGTDLAMCVCSTCHEKRQQLENAFRVALGRITRHIPLNRLEDEVWKILREVSDRENERLVEAFQ